MSLPALLNHLLNFALPALWMATLLTALPRLFARTRPAHLHWARHWLWLFAAGLAVLLAGLLVLQRDGAMLTWLALALVCGAMQAYLLR